MSIQLNSLVILAAVATEIVYGAPAKTITDPDDNFMTQLIDTKYPLTEPNVLSDGSVKYRIAIIADLDRNSVSPDEPFTWISYLKKGHLTYNSNTKSVLIEWDSPDNGYQLKSNLSMDGRGLELSELVTYNANLITLDDKTGLVYLINDTDLFPWVILASGDGQNTKRMKTEWATVKDSKLYVGSYGVEIKSKEEVDRSLMWVKTIDKSGCVQHLDWTENFIKVQAAIDIHSPGYVTHEAVVWSDLHHKWFLLPRKASIEQFDTIKDERMCTNVLFSASPDFNNIEVVRIGEIVPNHGFCSFKFIPETNHGVIAAIKSQEEGEITATFITVFTIDGEILYPETKVSDLKFEGFEFI